MPSFKYKNMQQFVKQTIHPYIVNVVLLIKDAFKHITRLDKRIDDTNEYIKDEVEPRIDVHDKIVGFDQLVLKDSNGQIVRDEDGNIQLINGWDDSTSNHETRLDKLETIVGRDYVIWSEFDKAEDNHHTMLKSHQKDIKALEKNLDSTITRLTKDEGYIKSNSDAIKTLQTSANNHIGNKDNPHNTKYTNLSDVYISTLPPGNNTTYDVWDQVL